MQQKDILKINRTILNDFASIISERVCLDQKICELSFTENKRSGDIVWSRAEIPERSRKRIVLILESPHRDEFKEGKDGVPANGTTGINIETHFDLFINRIIEKNSEIELDGDYEALIINSLEYQCSMGFSTGHFRTLSFIGIWFKGGKERFEKRLKDLKLEAGDIIVNACTIGKGSNSNPSSNAIFNQENLRTYFQNRKIEYTNTNGIKQLVRQSIDNLFSTRETRIVNTNHPSNWNEEKTSIIKD